ncbi:MAG: hypothetical protein ACI3YK_01680 [Eubacteriales bacterium]
MEKNNNKKALAIMLGTLFFLLVLAVVLLSVIIVSITGESDPPITEVSEQTTTIPDRTDLSSDLTSVITTTNPTTSFVQPSVTTEKQPDTGESTGVPTGPAQTDPIPPVTDDTPTQTTVTTTTRIPGSDAPNIPIGTVETITNSDGSVTKRGAFRDTGTPKVHLIVIWEATYPEKNSKTVELTVSVYLESYSIGVAARDNGTLIIGDNTTIFRTNAIFLSDNDVHRTLLTQKTLSYTKSSGTAVLELDIDAAWNFMGTYSGIAIDWITVSGTIEI